jgi:hypothetical protein
MREPSHSLLLHSRDKTGYRPIVLGYNPALCALGGKLFLL